MMAYLRRYLMFFAFIVALLMLIPSYDSTTGHLISIPDPESITLSYDYDGSLLTRQTVTGGLEVPKVVWCKDWRLMSIRHAKRQKKKGHRIVCYRQVRKSCGPARHVCADLNTGKWLEYHIDEIGIADGKDNGNCTYDLKWLYKHARNDNYKEVKLPKQKTNRKKKAPQSPFSKYFGI